MTVQIIRGNALALPIGDNSVDLICTSPPYFGLRSYTDAGEHYSGQLGSEATPAEFVDALIAATREMVRVVKPSGSIFVNLGDKYQSTAPGTTNTGRQIGAGAKGDRSKGQEGNYRPDMGVKPKSLYGFPWRYALRCIDDLGLILRAEIIWAKPNGLPESVTDRVRRSHEQWFHFTLEPRYYSAVDEIRETYGDNTHGGTGRANASKAGSVASGGQTGIAAIRPDPNPLGKLPGSVWSVPTQPLTVPASLGVDHFAAFPMEWPRRIIRGWSPSGVCTVCGQGRRPVAVASYDNEGRTTNGPQSVDRRFESIGFTARAVRQTTITGESCGCDTPTAPTRPSTVLDPFCGTGTAPLVASVLGRHGIGVDMSADYCRLAEWRCSDPGQIASAMQVDKPPAQVLGQEPLWA